MSNTLGSDTTEKDLWNFDEEEGTEIPENPHAEEPAESEESTEPEESTETDTPDPDPTPPVILTKFLDPEPLPASPEPVPPSPRGKKRRTIQRRPTGNTAGDDGPEPLQNLPKPRSSGIQSGKSGVSLAVSSNKSFEATTSAAKPGFEDLGDLDDWDEPEPAPKPSPTPEPPPEPEPTPAPASSSDPAPDSAPPEPADPALAEDTPPKTAPISLRPHLGLSKIEKIGLALLAAMLLAVVGLALNYTLGRLPTASATTAEIAFPVKGTRITIASADTFWREPLPAEPVRRGTVMIPVITLESSAGSGALRIFFRDENRNSIGDPVSVAIASPGPVTAAASAGFDGTGDYAAYRTPESKPWIIEIFEGPSANAPFRDFVKLFEIPVSTNRR